MSDHIVEYTKTECPVCGHRGWCGRREDGLVLCKRPPSPPEVAGFTLFGMAQDGATALYVQRGGEHRSQPVVHCNGKARHTSSKKTPSIVLREQCKKFESHLTNELRDELAALLGLPCSCLSVLPIGWWPEHRWWNSETHREEGEPGCWTFHEVDGQGRIIGVGLRWRSGKKGQLQNSSRGLTLPTGWREMPDPILVAEGPSDVLAGRSVGLNVIGRPSNTGGADLLAQTCQDRQLIILGENDQKGTNWPGKLGVESIVSKLEAARKRPVACGFPPEGIKDLRDWIIDLRTKGLDEIAIRTAILEALRPLPLQWLIGRPDRRNRVSIKVFRWCDGVTASPIHSDRLDLEEAADRRKFARAVCKVEPEAHFDEVSGHLLTLGTRILRSDDSKPSHSGEPSHATDDRPPIFLPGGSVSISDCGAKLGELLARPQQHFFRGGAVVTLTRDDFDEPIIETLKPAHLASAFESVAELMTYVKKDGELLAQRTVCSEQQAKLIMHCVSFQQALPKLRLLSPCPVLIERAGQLQEINGYDEDSGIWTHGPSTEIVLLEEAVRLLHETLSDFRFATPADRARALAAIITPAVILGQLILGRAPVDLGEADASQSGKGYRNKLTAAIYRQRVRAVTQKKGGVGSMEESFSTALIRGRNFICLDNVRGHIDSPAIESFLTEDSFLARVPHQAAVEVDPRRYIVQLTSNKADITIDMANRSSCVRILKQAAGFRFRNFPEGDIEDHVRSHQPQYLGAVFAVVRAWHDAGKPRTDETRHDFRPWAQTLDWIVQHVFKAGPLLDGHRETQIRMANPNLNWLRDLAIAVREAGQLDKWLRANDLLNIMKASNTRLLGVADGDDDAEESKALRALGRKLGQCFLNEDACRIDEFEIERGESADNKNRRDMRVYCFRVDGGCAHGKTGLPAMGANIPESDDASPAIPTQGSQGWLVNGICAHGAPIGAPMVAPINSAVAPIAPMEGQNEFTKPSKHDVLDNISDNNILYGKVMETMGALGAPLASSPPAPSSNQKLRSESPPTRWLTADQTKDLPRNVRGLVVDHPGWSPAAWRDRLLELASGCKELNRERAAELEQAAELMVSFVDQHETPRKKM